MPRYPDIDGPRCRAREQALDDALERVGSPAAAAATGREIIPRRTLGSSDRPPSGKVEYRGGTQDATTLGTWAPLRLRRGWENAEAARGLVRLPLARPAHRAAR